MFSYTEFFLFYVGCGLLEKSQRSAVSLHVIRNVAVTLGKIKSFELRYLNVATALASDKVAVITSIPKAISSIR